MRDSRDTEAFPPWDRIRGMGTRMQWRQMPGEGVGIHGKGSSEKTLHTLFLGGGIDGCSPGIKAGVAHSEKEEAKPCLTGCMVLSVGLTGTLATDSIACPKCFPQGKSVPAQDIVSLPISSGRQLAAFRDVLK